MPYDFKNESYEDKAWLWHELVFSSKSQNKEVAYKNLFTVSNIKLISIKAKNDCLGNFKLSLLLLKC